MLNFKSNVYRTEWLELVFADRNKLYGAYELRQNYSARLAKAMLLSVSFFVCLIAGPFLYGRFVKPAAVLTSLPKLTDDREITVYVVPKALPKKAVVPLAPAAPAIKQKIIRSTVPVVVPASEVTIEMPTQDQLSNAIIGSEDVKGVDVGTGANASGKPGGSEAGSSDGTAGTNEPFMSVQEMPEFPGGQAAFSKFLSKNLRYPSQAQESNLQGRVTVSFIVETDGSLSDIHVLRGIGAGCDEEAIRVIKKAPAWRAGRQNGRAVRVMYNVPIVFNLGE